MNHSYYQQKKERLQEQAKSCYYLLGDKEKAKNYYKDNTERMQKQAQNKYKKLSEEEK